MPSSLFCVSCVWFLLQCEAFNCFPVDLSANVDAVVEDTDLNQAAAQHTVMSSSSSGRSSSSSSAAALLQMTTHVQQQPTTAPTPAPAPAPQIIINNSGSKHWLFDYWKLWLIVLAILLGLILCCVFCYCCAERLIPCVSFLEHCIFFIIKTAFLPLKFTIMALQILCYPVKVWPAESEVMKRDGVHES
jgi:hypothetical protein